MTRAEVWDVASRRPQVEIPISSDWFTPLGFSGDGTRVAILESERSDLPLPGTVTVWDATSGKRVLIVFSCTPGLFDPTGALLTTVGTDGHAQVWRVAHGALEASFLPEQPLSFAQVNAAGDLLVSANIFGSSAAVIGVHEGSVLSDLGMGKVPLTLGQDIFNANALSAFSTGERSVLSIHRAGMTAWDIPIEHRSPEEIAAFVKARVPWRVVDGRLVPVSARLHGRVTYLGQGVKDAIIRNGTYNTISGADGAYELAVPPGPFGAEVLSESLGAIGTIGWPDGAQVNEGDNVIDVELHLSAAISGVVVDEAGGPVAGVHVGYGCADHGGEPSGRSRTASDGTFMVLVPGGCNYSASVWRPGKVLGSFPPIPVKDATTRITGIRLELKSAP
jgi:hypothetical protein